MELTERLQSDDGEKKWSRVTNDPSFGQLDSDSRFLAVFAALSQKSALAKKTSWIDHRGQKIARVDDETGWLRINVDKSVDADFGAFLVNQLPTLLKAYQANRDAAEL